MRVHRVIENKIVGHVDILISPDLVEDYVASLGPEYQILDGDPEIGMVFSDGSWGFPAPLSDPDPVVPTDAELINKIYEERDSREVKFTSNWGSETRKRLWPLLTEEVKNLNSGADPSTLVALKGATAAALNKAPNILTDEEISGYAARVESAMIANAAESVKISNAVQELISELSSLNDSERINYSADTRMGAILDVA